MRTRREFIGGLTKTPAEHIASILVQARPEVLPRVEAELTRLPGVESHGSNGKGKLILTLETRSDAELMERITRIETAEGVVSASLVFHQVEEPGHES